MHEPVSENSPVVLGRLSHQRKEMKERKGDFGDGFIHKVSNPWRICSHPRVRLQGGVETQARGALSTE